MNRTWDLRSLAEWRGKDVMTSDDQRLGEVYEIVYDYITEMPEWIGVEGGPLGIRTFLVPAVDAEPEEGYLRIPYPKDMILQEPEFDLGEGFSDAGSETALHNYFGLGDHPHHETR